MLWTNISNFSWQDYNKTQDAIQYLKSKNWTNIPDGRIDVNEDFYAQVLSYDTETIEQFDFEVHYERLDIHYLAAGTEVIEVSNEETDETEYIKERDLAYVKQPRFFNEVKLQQEDILIIGKKEPHRTNGSINSKPGHVKKVVLKMKY